MKYCAYSCELKRNAKPATYVKINEEKIAGFYKKM